MKKSIITATVILIAGLITIAIWFQPGSPPLENDPVTQEIAEKKEPVPEHDPGVARPAQKKPAAKPGKKDEKDELTLIAEKCREKYGHLLSEPKAQVAMLDKLMAYFAKKYPEDWQAHIEAFIKAAFPEHAARLLATLDRLTAYNTWLAESREQLTGMSRKEKRELMWQRRREFFGEDAEKIWEAQLKSESVYQALDDLNAGEFDSYDEKVSHFVDSISDAYGEESDHFIEKRRQELLDVFLENESVQEDLAQFDAQERKDALRKLRLEMGVDQDAITRLEELDTIRDNRWENGLAYMEKRNELAAQYQGEELEERLDALREEHFGSNAEHIKGEEAAGLFRFKLRRVFGKN